MQKVTTVDIEITEHKYNTEHQILYYINKAANCSEIKCFVYEKVLDSVINPTLNSQDVFTDLEISGNGPKIEILRDYTSENISNGCFGYGWSFNYNLKLSINIDGTVKISNNKTVRVYFKNYDNTYSPAIITANRLVKNLDGSYTEILSDNTKNVFNDSGLLMKVTDNNEQSSIFEYTAEKLTQITDASGRIIMLNWSGDKITSITYPDNKTYNYLYSYNKLIKVIDPKGYTIFYENNLLVKQTNPFGDTKIFNYDDSGNLI